jgi:hypothetical protein
MKAPNPRTSAIGPAPAPACPPHADWCERYGLPTAASACAVCTAERADPDTGAEFAQQMRNAGRAYGALACAHREPTGETIERRCCGGQVRPLPVYRCARTGTAPAPCAKCREKKPATG